MEIRVARGCDRIAAEVEERHMTTIIKFIRFPNLSIYLSMFVCMYIHECHVYKISHATPFHPTRNGPPPPSPNASTSLYSREKRNIQGEGHCVIPSEQLTGMASAKLPGHATNFYGKATIVTWMDTQYPMKVIE